MRSGGYLDEGGSAKETRRRTHPRNDGIRQVIASTAFPLTDHNHAFAFRLSERDKQLVDSREEQANTYEGKGASHPCSAGYSGCESPGEERRPGKGEGMALREARSHPRLGGPHE
jgi:hypothetical protein